MPRQKGYRHIDDVRAKIQASQIVNRLTKCAMGEIDLTPSQVNAAKTLLDKVLPNLQAVDLTVEKDNVEWLIADKPMTVEEYEAQFATRALDAPAGASDKAPALPN